MIDYFYILGIIMSLRDKNLMVFNERVPEPTRIFV